MKKKPLQILLCVAAAVLLGGSLILFHHLQGKKETIHSRQFPVMGTLGRITLYGVSEEKAFAAMDAVQRRIFEIEKLCSIFDPESALFSLNRSAGKKAVPCPEELFHLLEECDRFYKVSHGAFDVTIRPLMKLWGFYRKRKTLPSEKEIAETLKTVSWKHVVLHRKEKKVSFRRKGISLDLGGIAKGYALDQASLVLKSMGIQKFVLDLGGNLLCRNADEKDKPFRIGIRHPKKTDQVWKEILLRNGAVATSGNYERYVVIGGKRYTHIMDPRNGNVVTGMLSVTVITPQGIDSDALSTTVFVLGKIPENLPADTRVFIFREEASPEEKSQK